MKKYQLILLVVTCLFVACNKSDNNDPPNDLSIFACHTISEALMEDIDQIASKAIVSQGSSLIALSKVACSPAVDVNVYDRTITINFGTNGCVGSDGLVRKGVITVEATSLELQTGTAYTIRSNNYQVNGFQVMGQITKRINACVGTVVTKAYFFEDIQVVYPDGTVITRGGSNDREYKTDGDDVLVSIYGAVNITDVDKETKAGCVVIYNNPLVYSIKNQEIVRGIMSIVVDEQPSVWTIDFGNGNADNQMSVSDGKDTWTVNIAKLDN